MVICVLSSSASAIYRPNLTAMFSCTVQVEESIKTVYCFFRADTEWHKAPVAEAFGILINGVKPLVAIVATVVFSGFAIVVYLKAVIGCMLCQAKGNLRKQQSRLEHHVDQRHIFQKVSGIFY